MSAVLPDPQKVRLARAFIDAIENDTAHLLVDAHVLRFPVALLPSDAKEGRWIEIEITLVPTPAEGEKLELERKKLASDDDGGDIAL